MSLGETHNASRRTGAAYIFLFAQSTGVEVADRGAGEILLTCMHRDGTGIGFDTDLTRQVSEQVNIQVIASGGAKTEQHFLDAFENKADACLAAGMFHSGQYRVEQVKQFLSQHGVAVR